MWKSTVGVKPVAASAVLGRNDDDDDDWETGERTRDIYFGYSLEELASTLHWLQIPTT